MITENILYFSIILFVIIVTSGMSWREKNKARNFVLSFKPVLEDLLNEAEGLLEVNPDTHPTYVEYFNKMRCELINMFDGINENSFDVCWISKQKEVSEFQKTVIDKISKIKQAIKAEPNTTELYTS